MRFRYTREQLDFLRVGYRSMRIPELTRQFNSAFGLSKTPSQIRCCLSNHGFKCGRGPGHRKGERLMLSPEQVRYLKRVYRKLPAAASAVALNEHFGTAFTAQQIKSFVHNHGIDSGRTGQFEKGQKAWNAGTKGVMKPNRTSFKKGNMSGAAQRNYVPIGTTRLSKEGYLERKVTDDHPVPARRWVAEHRLIWEAAHGPVPTGHVVVFLDGDKRNLALENLRCVPRGVLAHLNQRHHRLCDTTGELRTSAIATAELMARANQRAKA